MKVLVTGSAGFIGFNLARRLLDDGNQVTGIDNFSDYYSVELKRNRQSVLDSYKNFKGYESDISSFSDLNRIVELTKPDVVCNLAAQTGVRNSINNPFIYQQSNIQGFLNVLETCRRVKPHPRLVYASSSSVYAGNEKIPFSETDPVDTPVSLYGATKRANELMAHSYSRLFDLQTIGLRFFSVYGPWGRPDSVMWIFARAMLAGETINVYNEGNMWRDFTFIDDVVDGICSAIYSESLDVYELMNLGNGKAEKLMDMIYILADKLDVEPKMNLMSMQPGDIPESCADISKAGEKLDFKPVTGIKAGISEFIDWYMRYHKSEKSEFI